MRKWDIIYGWQGLQDRVIGLLGVICCNMRGEVYYISSIVMCVYFKQLYRAVFTCKVSAVDDNSDSCVS